VADVLRREKGPPPARVRMRGRVEAVEAALKPLKSPPPARVWTRGRWKRGGGVVGVSGIVMVSHCRFVLVVRLATSVFRNGRIDGDALNGPPTSWVPPRVSLSPASPSID
jgi:hypothetical protein